MAALACSTFLAFLKASSWLNSLYASKDFWMFGLILSSLPLFMSRMKVASTAF